ITPTESKQTDGCAYAAGTTREALTGLAARSHTVAVKDAHSCAMQKSITVGEPTAVTLSLDKTDVSCNGGSDGTVIATFSGGTPPYKIQIDGGGYAAATSPKTFTGLAATSHTVDVQDANTCPASKSITVGSPTAVTYPPAKT